MLDAEADSEHEHGRRAVEHVSGGHLLRPRLQQRCLRIARAPILAQDAEDRADAAADVEVRRAIERIEQHAVLALALGVPRE